MRTSRVLAVSIFSDIDYYFASRLPGEPLEGVSDIHFPPGGAAHG